MDKTTRYLILVFIFIVFLALAPLIVLYVSGRNFSLDEFASGTGILDIQSKPAEAQVLLNGELINRTPTTVRFIKQGTYELEIQKDGYYPWRKQLFIEAGQVTYAGPLNDVVKLLPRREPIRIADSVQTMTVVENTIVYIGQDNTAFIYDLDSGQIIRSTVLKDSISELIRVLSRNFILAKNRQGQLFVLDTRTLILTKIPNELATSSNIELISERNLLAQRGSDLVAYTLTSPDLPQLVTKNIRAFTALGNTIYIATPGSNGLETYLWDGKTLSLQNVLHAGAIPQGQTTTLYLTTHKELFLKVDRALYRVNPGPELISDQVELVSFNAERQQLTFTTPAETYFYNFISGAPELFHRTTQPITSIFVVPELGYGFTAVENEVLAIEIDKRNGQNQHTLLAGAPVTRLMLNGNEKQLVILAGDSLQTIVVN